jgi:hypothetical protein
MTRRLALTLKFTLKSFLSVSIPLPIYLWISWVKKII